MILVRKQREEEHGDRQRDDLFLDVSTVEQRKHTVCLQSSRCSTTLSTIRIAGTKSVETFSSVKVAWQRERERESQHPSFEKEILLARETQQRFGNFVFVAIVSHQVYLIRKISRRLIAFDPIAVLCIEFFAEENAEEKKFLGNWKFDDGRKVFVSAGNESNLNHRSWYKWKGKKRKIKKIFHLRAVSSSSPCPIRFNPVVKINSAAGNSVVFPIVTSRYFSSLYISVATKREAICNAMLFLLSTSEKEKGKKKNEISDCWKWIRWPMISLI